MGDMRVREWMFFLVGVGLTLVGMWLTLYLRPGRRLNVYISTDHLTNSAMSPDHEVALKFRGQSVNGIAKHVIYVWNSGNVSIRASDIPPDTPLSVEFGQGAMVSIRSLSKVGETFQIDAMEYDNTVVLKLNHLDTGQGFVLCVIEGVRSLDGYSGPVFHGHILDSRGIKGGVSPVSVGTILEHDRLYLAALFLSIFGAVIIIALTSPYGTFSLKDDFTSNLLSGVLGVFLSMAFAALPTSAKLAPAIRYRVPTFIMREEA